MPGEEGREVTKVEGRAAPSPTISFGKYQLFAALGRGGMADVFLSVARGPMGFSKLAVIKRLKPSLAAEVVFRTMFLDEARLAARLNHPNIVHTYEVGEYEGSYFIAMEYLEGQSLNKVMKALARAGKRLEPRLAARIAADALAGLAHAHELRDYDGAPLQIVHRDVSPHNVFVGYDGYVKLVDFGIAKTALSSTETEIGVLKGKVAYMAPEQAAGVSVDARADLFAVGIILWELLVGERLFAAESAAASLHKIANLPVPRLRAFRPELDPGLAAIVERALEKQPEHRFQTAHEFRAALEAWLASQAVPTDREEIGAHVVALFGSVRESVQRQVQMHMQVVRGAENTQELASLSAESLVELERNGEAFTGELLRLAATSSSAVVAPSAPPDGSSRYHVEKPIVEVPEKPRRAAAWLTLAFGLGALVALLLLVRGQVERVQPRAQEPAGRSGPVALSIPQAREVASERPGVANGSTRGSTSASSDSAPPSPAAASPEVPRARETEKAGFEIADPGLGTAKTDVGHAGGRGGKRVPTQPSRPVARSTTTTATPEAAPGTLTLDTYPWTRVSEGGRPLGATPLIKIQLPAGTHVLLLENPEKGIRQTATVVVPSGGHVAKRLGLE